MPALLRCFNVMAGSRKPCRDRISRWRESCCCADVSEFMSSLPSPFELDGPEPLVSFLLCIPPSTCICADPQPRLPGCLRSDRGLALNKTDISSSNSRNAFGPAGHVPESGIPVGADHKAAVQPLALVGTPPAF